jgi:hypothetical protein
MTHDNQFDFEAGDCSRNSGRRLDSGNRSDGLLDLAARIQELYPAPEGPSATFQANLRAHLLDQYARGPEVERPSTRGWRGLRSRVAWALALLVVIVLTFAGLQRLSGSVPVVSAAEVLEKASRRLSARSAAGDVIYDRLILDWDQGGDWKRSGVVGELWRSADGSRLRYQMYDRQSLLYFEQHDSQSLWRSSFVRPVEGVVVNFVYQAPYVPGSKSLEDRQLVAQLLFRDLANFWIYIDQMAGAGRTDCADLFCVLSSLGQGWECSEKHCTLNLGPVFGDKDLIVEANVAGIDRLEDGREVYEVRLKLAGVGEQDYQTLKFDTTTFDLLEIEDFWGGKLHYRIRLDERKTLAWSDLPEGFFQSVPEGIEVRPWLSNLPLGHKEDDHAWIISADPPSGASLSGKVNGHLVIGYRLTSIQEAAITVGMGWVGHDTPYSIRDANMPITAGEGTVEMSFTLDTDQLGQGRWAVGPGFTDVLGIVPNTGWGNAGSPVGIYMEWCIRCPSVTPGQ